MFDRVIHASWLGQPQAITFNRQRAACQGRIVACLCWAASSGERMIEHRFFAEHFVTPIGTMLLATDAEGHVRALDWEDYAARMHRLLRLQYGTVRLEPKDGVSPARQAMEAYFDGALGAIDSLSVKTGGTEFQRT